MDDWLHLLQAAASEDRDACADWSFKLGYLTGEENEVCAPSSYDSYHRFSCHITDYVECSRGYHGLTRDTLQTIYSPTVCVWARFPLGKYHWPDPCTYSDHAAA